MKMIAALLLSIIPTIASAQTAEDAQVDHEGRLANAALNAQYHQLMAAMAAADHTRDAELKSGTSKPDGRPTYQGALLTAERDWLAYRDAHCVAAGLVFRGGVYEDTYEGKCANAMTRKRTAELKALSDSMHQWVGSR